MLLERFVVSRLSMLDDILYGITDTVSFESIFVVRLGLLRLGRNAPYMRLVLSPTVS